MNLTVVIIKITWFDCNDTRLNTRRFSFSGIGKSITASIDSQRLSGSKFTIAIIEFTAGNIVISGC